MFSYPNFVNGQILLSAAQEASSLTKKTHSTTLVKGQGNFLALHKAISFQDAALTYSAHCCLAPQEGL